ncbi:hypothetical protein [uncultured Clostridium sp.]|uniref:hypothetical protein n=1 Tax=uncultured Clostridium sp. TaxID=59620 RepID=UPI0025E18437|nr:hypothetical protein [uncultured Clostridium sp.]
MQKDYMPIEVHSVKNFINQHRQLKSSRFEFDTKYENCCGELKETIIYFDFMLEFSEEDPIWNRYDCEKELYYYIPIKFEIMSNSNVSDKEIKRVVTNKMFEIKRNFDYCLMMGQDNLIIQNRIVEMEI